VQGNRSIDFRLLYYDELKPKVLPQSSVVGCLSLWSNPDPDLAQTARRADLSPSRRKSEMHPVVRRKDMTLALDFWGGALQPVGGLSTGHLDRLWSGAQDRQERGPRRGKLWQNSPCWS